MTVPFMRAYTELLVRTCHRRGAHAMGGMAAQIPSRTDEEANEVAFAALREDKRREAADGFDGTWVAHPDSVAAAMQEFDEVLVDKPHQPTADRRGRGERRALLAVRPRGAITEAGCAQRQRRDQTSTRGCAAWAPRSTDDGGAARPRSPRPVAVGPPRGDSRMDARSPPSRARARDLEMGVGAQIYDDAGFKRGPHGPLAGVFEEGRCRRVRRVLTLPPAHGSRRTRLVPLTNVGRKPLVGGERGRIPPG